MVACDVLTRSIGVNTATRVLTSPTKLSVHVLNAAAENLGERSRKSDSDEGRGSANTAARNK